LRSIDIIPAGSPPAGFSLPARKQAQLEFFGTRRQSAHGTAFSAAGLPHLRTACDHGEAIERQGSAWLYCPTYDLDDPMKDDRVTGWLKSELKPPARK
jgi:hypothetical protein